MEVGAVKQAYNNEVILLKKNLNQAKTQVIHKLIRKAKQLTHKKCPESLKEKMKRKSESAIKEVFIIKKIKARDIAKFIVTHKEQLNYYLNKPNVDNNKAYARLLLHKSMTSKYELIRSRFANVSINDLLMSRQERLKLKKEAKEKQKNKKKKPNSVKSGNVDGEWKDSNISKEDMEVDTKIGQDDDNDNSVDDDDDNESSNEECDLDDESDDKASEDHIEENHLLGKSEKVVKTTEDIIKTNNNKSRNDFDAEDLNEHKINETGTKPIKLSKGNNSQNNAKIKDKNKNKNLQEKLLKRNFSKKSDDENLQMNKVVDPFFVTASGDSYMSLVEPRPPDEIKELHKEGNRQYRRAVMFGHAPKSRPRKENFSNSKESNNVNNKQIKFQNNNKSVDKWSNKQEFRSKNVDSKNIKEDAPEKLHPSWEAKKKQSTILPFQGKKIVFEDN